VDASTLHQRLVDWLTIYERIRTPQVEAAFRAVPRHHFLPTAPLREVYRDTVIATKVIDGRFVSSSSQPSIMAEMLEQLGLEPGQRVLEIGTGTGYNAALLAHAVGETGQVTSVDLDEDTASTARQRLVELGFGSVQVVCADGNAGYLPNAPYDRVILTVGATDIEPAWYEQLAPDGRLVVPLELIGQVMKVVAFERRDGYLESVSTANCTFMMLRGSVPEPPAGTLRIRAYPRPPDSSPAHRWVIVKPGTELVCEYDPLSDDDESAP